jgi:hypothetical protein
VIRLVLEDDDEDEDEDEEPFTLGFDAIQHGNDS